MRPNPPCAYRHAGGRPGTVTLTPRQVRERLAEIAEAASSIAVDVRRADPDGTRPVVRAFNRLAKVIGEYLEGRGTSDAR